jgi:oligopeptide/dipeptide ABC transporter ATP-binding protein
MPENSRNDDLVEARNLVKYYPIRGGVFLKEVAAVKAVDDVSLTIRSGETMGLVGESGCGKTTFGRAILRLEEPTAGEVIFKGRNLLACDAKEMRGLRKQMQIIFQDPFSSLNPRKTIAQIIGEPLLVHGMKNRKQREERVLYLLDVVGLRPEQMRRYPHMFSGGQRQRISIARALAGDPEFLVCDEPTSALDVSVQAQVLNLMKRLQRDFGLTYLFISHDLSVVRHMADEIAVMYLGRIVEIQPKADLFERPLHPYTRMLLDTIPDLQEPNRDRKPMGGEVPSPIAPPKGCSFHPRCPLASDRCTSERPVRKPDVHQGRVACFAVEDAAR